MLYDPEVDAYCLRLMSSPDEPPVAEYWFGSFEQAERQAVVVFGARFTGWSEGASWAEKRFAEPMIADRFTQSAISRLAVKVNKSNLTLLGPSKRSF
jgi:hypothetical protein